MAAEKEPMLASVGEEQSGAFCLFSLLSGFLLLAFVRLSPSCPAPPLFITPQLSKSARAMEPSPFCHLQ